MAITENEHSLNLAKTRLAMRLQRPGKEQCYDLAQAQLLTEIQHLTSHIKKYGLQQNRCKMFVLHSSNLMTMCSIWGYYCRGHTSLMSFCLCVVRLREETAQSQEQQRALVCCKLRMEEDVDMKASSLYIDEVICTQLREPVRIHTF